MTSAQENIWIITIMAALVAAILGFGLALAAFDIQSDARIELFRAERCTCDTESTNAPSAIRQNGPSVGAVASYGATIFSFWVIFVAAVALRKEFASAGAGSPAESALAARDSWSGLVRWGILVLLTPFIVFGGSVLLFAAIAIASKTAQDFSVGVASVLVAAYMGAIVYLVVLWIGAFRTVHLNVMAGAVFTMGLIGSAVSTTNTDWWRIAISSLGVDNAGSEPVLDYTLLLAGLLMLAYTFDLYVKLRLLRYVGTNQWPRHTRYYMLFVGIAVALGLALVAIIDKGVLHTGGAMVAGALLWVTMTVTVGIPILLHKYENRVPAWLTRMAGTTFFRWAIVPAGFSVMLGRVSVVLGLGILVSGVLWVVNEVSSIPTGVNLVGLELVIFVSVIFWLHYFGVYVEDDLKRRGEDEVEAATEAAF